MARLWDRGCLPASLPSTVGLSSGSVTALLDRLQRAGYVERFDDPNDRRRVLVRACPNAIKPIERVYSAMQTKMVALWPTFDADELRIIYDFITRSTDIAVGCRKNLRGSRPRDHRTKNRSSTAPQRG